MSIQNNPNNSNNYKASHDISHLAKKRGYEPPSIDMVTQNGTQVSEEQSRVANKAHQVASPHFQIGPDRSYLGLFDDDSTLRQGLLTDQRTPEPERIGLIDPELRRKFIPQPTTERLFPEVPGPFTEFSKEAPPKQ